MIRKLLFAIVLLASITARATDYTICSPDGRLIVTISDEGGKASYKASFDGYDVITPSLLGINANYADFTQGLKIVNATESKINKSYDMTRIKTSHINYQANQIKLELVNEKNLPLQIVFNVSNNNIAYRYLLPRPEANNPKVAVVNYETSSFQFPSATTTFLTPQITPMTGWERTKPSYEEDYKADKPLSTPSQFGVGYTFPCLFKIPSEKETLWALVSETGVTSAYCGSRLSDWDAEKGYTVTYPQEGEANGWGSNTVAIPLPGETPWRTITIGNSLKPIVETTIPYDVVEPLYEPKYTYKPGRYTWSWLIWQDNSINYNDQKEYIDLAAKMGYEYVLVDNFWDTQIGYDKIEELSKYAQNKGVHLMLWYSSNGVENDAPQGPRNIMNNSIARKKEMKWMQKIGVKGIKVDFFGGDKQHTMQLYEDILSDANEYGLQVVFHGCTLPRGWERMYPNFVASEACLASENVYFSDYHAKQEGFEMTMHPFARNTVASFDWGGVIMNRYMSKDNKSRHQRETSDVFEMATAITNQTSINCVEVTPNGIETLKDFELDWLRQIPTTWDETRFIDGYPTKYAVIARRTGEKWYVGGINGTDKPITLTLDLDMLAGKKVKYLFDQKKNKNALWSEPAAKEITINKNGKITVTIQPMGGIILNQPNVSSQKSKIMLENEVLKAIHERRSIRRFKPEQVTDEELQTVLEAGTWAPTGHGTQAPFIVAVQNKEQIETLSKINGEIMGVTSDPYYGAPTLVLVFAPKDNENNYRDGSLVLGTMMLAAHSIGLSSCWINRVDSMSEREDIKKLMKEWGLPEGLTGIGSLALGYASSHPKTIKPRKDNYYRVIK